MNIPHVWKNQPSLCPRQFFVVDPEVITSDSLMELGQSSNWARSKTATSGAVIAIIGGILSLIFGFMPAGDVADIGGVISAAIFAAGMVVLARRAGSALSAGFLSFGVGVFGFVLSGIAGGLASDLLLLIATITAIAGGILVGISLGRKVSTTTGRATAYVFLVGGLFTSGAGILTLLGLFTSDMTLMFGVSGILWVVVGPILLYLATRQFKQLIEKPVSANFKMS